MKILFWGQQPTVSLIEQEIEVKMSSRLPLKNRKFLVIRQSCQNYTNTDEYNVNIGYMNQEDCPKCQNFFNPLFQIIWKMFDLTLPVSQQKGEGVLSSTFQTSENNAWWQNIFLVISACDISRTRSGLIHFFPTLNTISCLLKRETRWNCIVMITQSWKFGKE